MAVYVALGVGLVVGFVLGLVSLPLVASLWAAVVDTDRQDMGA